MLVVLKRDSSELAREAALTIAKAVRANLSLKLGLATGITMLGMYQELARLHQQEGADFSRIVKQFGVDKPRLSAELSRSRLIAPARVTNCTNW